MPHGVLLSEFACDALPSRVALSSELRATTIGKRTSPSNQLLILARLITTVLSATSSMAKAHKTNHFQPFSISTPHFKNPYTDLHSSYILFIFGTPYIIKQNLCAFIFYNTNCYEKKSYFKYEFRNHFQ